MDATLNDRQREKLRDIAKVSGIRQLACQSQNDAATLKALYRRGLITLRYIGSRAWAASLTQAGRDALDLRAVQP